MGDAQRPELLFDFCAKLTFPQKGLMGQSLWGISWIPLKFVCSEENSKTKIGKPAFGPKNVLRFQSEIPLNDKTGPLLDPNYV